MKAATRERDTWGAAWRQRDFDFFTSPEFRQLLQEQNIKLITWRELARCLPALSPAGRLPCLSSGHHSALFSV